jgi:type II secretory pathway pseudopilin PulG
VVLVVGLLLTIAVPRLPSFGATDLEASAERLASTMTWMADEASLRGRLYRLTLDLDTERWEVAAIAPWAVAAVGSSGEAAFVEDSEDPMARTVALPDGVFFESVTGAEGEDRFGRRALHFLPEGSDESLSIVLGESEGARARVVFDAARGVARVEEVEVTGR